MNSVQIGNYCYLILEGATGARSAGTCGSYPDEILGAVLGSIRYPKDDYKPLYDVSVNHFTTLLATYIIYSHKIYMEQHVCTRAL